MKTDDYVTWSNQQYKLRLLQQLTYNDDAHNIRNVIYDPSFRVYCIDNSRSFRHFHSLANESGLRRFSRVPQICSRELESARRADAKRQARSGSWLQNIEIQAVPRATRFARRSRRLPQGLAAELGEDAIYYP